MPTEICPVCHSRDSVEFDVSNWPEQYYCSNCDRRFNPSEYPCLRCESDEHVSRNPLDDPLQYVCYDCEFVFHHPGPSFDASAIIEGTTEGEHVDSTSHLVFEPERPTLRLPEENRIVLRNVGSDPVLLRGRDSIALQLQYADDEWWTLYGNPDTYTPDEEFELSPDEELSWTTRFQADGIAVKSLFLRREPVLPGNYRFVYWGLESTDSVLATRFSVEHPDA